MMLVGLQEDLQGLCWNHCEDGNSKRAFTKTVGEQKRGAVHGSDSSDLWRTGNNTFIPSCFLLIPTPKILLVSYPRVKSSSTVWSAGSEFQQASGWNFDFGCWLPQLWVYGKEKWLFHHSPQKSKKVSFSEYILGWQIKALNIFLTFYRSGAASVPHSPHIWLHWGMLIKDNPRIFISSIGTLQATQNGVCHSYIKEDGKLFSETRGSPVLKM